MFLIFFGLFLRSGSRGGHFTILTIVLQNLSKLGSLPLGNGATKGYSLYRFSDTNCPTCV